MSSSLHLVDLLIVVGCFVASILIGVYFSRRQTGTGSFFLGEGRMSGWLVGFSITASMISAMTFLANPGFSFKEDARWVLPGFCFALMGIFSMYFVAPFFRRVAVPSGYEYLEGRFGTWARVYAAGAFLIFKLLRLGIVLYVTSISLEVFLGIPAQWLMLGMGVVATVYTLTGGFEAVVWTEFFQTIMLAVGGFILLPAAIYLIPGGWQTVWDTAEPAGKFSLGSLDFTLTEKTIWVMILSSLFVNASDYTTRQDFIQRMRAPRSLGQARLALAIGSITVVPIWIYFTLLGIVLWVLYQVHPDPVVTAFADSDPEKIVPHFVATKLPPGISGVVFAGILMASMSSIAPILNASAVTFVSDFYQRFLVTEASERHYMRVSRLSTGAFGVVMIVLALWVHATRTETLQDFHYTVQVLLSAGLFGLFMVGFFSHRTGNRAALAATLITAVTVVAWFVLASETAQAAYPSLATWVPDLFWVPVISNIQLPVLALILNRWTGEHARGKDGFTYHGVHETADRP